MKKITKFSSKIKCIYAASAIMTCMIMLIVNPVISNRGDRDGTFYHIVINGKQIGSVLEKETGDDYVAEMRKQKI